MRRNLRILYAAYRNTEKVKAVSENIKHRRAGLPSGVLAIISNGRRLFHNQIDVKGSFLHKIDDKKDIILLTLK